MKIFVTLLFAFAIFVNNTLEAAQTAKARMFCHSIRFDHAAAGGQNALYSLDLTGIAAGINGELYPDDGPRTHRSFLELTDDLFDEEFSGVMDLDVPSSDSDGDGFDDIFDTAQAFAGSSTGTFNIPGYAQGSVTALWSRAAGAEAGTCRLTFQNGGQFFHTFHILEYRGQLTYTPASSVVSASVDMTLTGDPNSKLKGPIPLTKSVSNPANELSFVNGTWTNTVPATPEVFSFVGNVLVRHPAWPTNYYQFGFEFDDWRLDTAERDYYYWVLSIDDLNDADHDGIPDLSDTPILVRRPLLGVARAGTNVNLSISGDVGQVCAIQQSATVNATNWPTISSITLTNDPQTVSLPLPLGGTAFWRVQVQ